MQKQKTLSMAEQRMADFSPLNELDELQFIPVGKKKNPIPKDWQFAKKKYDLTSCYNVGLVCGEPSKDSNGAMVECIDIDQKYSVDGKLYSEFRKMLSEVMGKEFCMKLCWQKTKNGGYHIIYRCKDIQGNQKLANRPTTSSEREETFQRVYNREICEGKSEADAVKQAERERDNDKVRVLIETRGKGGQFVVAPSDGYQFIHGDLYSISEITSDERAIMMAIAASFNEVVEEEKPSKAFKAPKTKSLNFDYKSPFDDYNERGDVVGLLQQHGWKVIKQKGPKTLVLRPAATTSATSGNYDEKLGWFSVFSTSTEFTPMKAYKPYAVYTFLEHKGDWNAAWKALYEKNYGDRLEDKPKEKAPSTRIIQSRIDPNSDDLSFLAKPEDWNPYLQQVRDGTLPQGLTTGCPSLDEYFLFKRGNMVTINGIDNVGKSVFIWWLLLIAAMYHGWKAIIFSSENTVGGFMRKMIQFYWGMPLAGKVKMTPKHEATAKEFIERHFKIIKAQEDLYNYVDIVNMVRLTMKHHGKYQSGLIDPYNSLKIDLSGFSKLNTHEYHYQAASELKAFGQQNQFGWFINHHAVTQAARAKDGEKKYPAPPNKADTEGGQKFANKTDDFITIHRLTQHPEEYNVTDLYIRKIKDTETGGRPSPLEQPVRFEMYNNGCGFREKLMLGYGVDPIRRWHEMNGTQSEIFYPEEPVRTLASLITQTNSGSNGFGDSLPF